MVFGIGKFLLVKVYSARVNNLERKRSCRGNILEENIKCLHEKYYQQRKNEGNSRHGLFLWEGST